MTHELNVFINVRTKYDNVSFSYIYNGTSLIVQP